MKLKKFLKATVGITEKAVVSGAKIVKSGAENLYETVKEDRTMLEEIKRINKFCENLVADFNSDKKNADIVFAQEQQEYSDIIQKINSQFEILNILPIFSDNKKLNFQLNGDVQKLNYENENFFNASDVIAYKKGGAAGLAVGVGTVGIMTAFGTAGTGAALSSLTGSAYIHATLAALGGGTLASGGFGMLGGAFVLGTAFLAPAIAVTGYITNKQIKKAYQDALTRQKKADEFKIASKEFFTKYEEGIKIFRQINRELYSFANFFGDLLNMSFAAPTVKNADKYLNILNHAAQTVLSYEQLTFINADGTFNDNIKKEIAAVKNEDNLCHEEFYSYRAELDFFHQNILNELKEQKIINDKLQKEIQWQKNNQPQNYIVRNRTIRNEFNKALQTANEELDIISAWMNFSVVNESLQQSFENLLRRGVIIKILYGIGDMGAFTVDSRNKRTNEVANHLKDRFRRYSNFKMKCANTHDKLFICDEKFYVHSSMNILSFNAEYNSDDVREEGGEASNNLKLIREYRKLLFNF